MKTPTHPKIIKMPPNELQRMKEVVKELRKEANI
jgi:hypothetical protein